MPYKIPEPKFLNGGEGIKEHAWTEKLGGGGKDRKGTNTKRNVYFPGEKGERPGEKKME